MKRMYWKKKKTIAMYLNRRQFLEEFSPIYSAEIEIELESVSSDSKAPTYSGSQLKANNEKGKIEATTYESKHAMTKTPGDTKTSVKSSTYGVQSGKIAPRKDAKVIRSFAPMAEMMRDELTALKVRQNIGRRRELFRL